MGPVLWARLAETGTLPPRTEWEPCCRQSLGVSVLGWGALNETSAISVLFAVFLKGIVSLVAFHTVSHGGKRGFCFGPHKSVLKRLGNAENTIDCNRWIWLAVAELKET